VENLFLYNNLEALKEVYQQARHVQVLSVLALKVNMRMLRRKPGFLDSDIGRHILLSRGLAAKTNRVIAKTVSKI
jgi:hypothetical protein